MYSKDGHNQGLFFPKSKHFFRFSKRGWEGIIAHPRVWINMHQYLWISLNISENACIMFWLWQGSKYAWSSWVLDVPEFWILHGCICKGYTEFWICLKMAQYASIMPESVSVWLNVPVRVNIKNNFCAWTLLQWRWYWLNQTLPSRYS